TVNQIWLSARAAVPTALLALEVQRGRMPGAPGGTTKSVNRHPFLFEQALREAGRHAGPIQKPALARSKHNSGVSSYRDRPRERNCDPDHRMMTRALLFLSHRNGRVGS